MEAATEMSNAKPTVNATMPQFWLNDNGVSMRTAKEDCRNSVTIAVANPKATATISTDSPTDDNINCNRLLPKILRVLRPRNRSGTNAKKKLM